MQKCQFSETQYAFCFTFEYLNSNFVNIPLPYFPNTVQEGRTGGGFDVQIDGNLYFQFKIPKYYDLVCNFFRLHWDVFSSPYLKIEVKTDSTQHDLLKKLANANNRVFYATPEFHRREVLATHFESRSIVRNSALFPLSELPAYRSGHHSLVYDAAHNWGKLFTEPKRIKKAMIQHPREIFSGGRGATVYDEAIRVRKILLANDFAISGDFKLDIDRPGNLINEVYTILLVDFDIHWLVIPKLS